MRMKFDVFDFDTVIWATLLKLNRYWFKLIDSLNTMLNSKE